MKHLSLIAAIIQLCIGIAAVAAFIIVAVGAEPLGKWIVTLILAIAFIVLGTIGIVDWVKEKRGA